MMSVAVSRFFVLLCLPITASTSTRVVAESAHPRVETASEGIKLTLQVPSGAYPVDALVRVTVQAVNVSQHAIQLGADLTQGCSLSTADAEVVTGQDSVVYP